MSIGRYETFSKQNERTVVMNYLRNELGENADNLYVLYNDTERGMCVDKLKDARAYALQELISGDRCYLLRRKGYANNVQEKGYTKADYDREHEGPPDRARELIENAPTVKDTVEVIRCKDCRYYIYSRVLDSMVCENILGMNCCTVTENDFCSAASKRKAVNK